MVLLFQFYYLPSTAKPYVLSLSGKWEANYSQITKTINIPGLFYDQGLIPEYKGSTWNVRLHRKISIKDTMKNKDLFIIVLWYYLPNRSNND